MSLQSQRAIVRAPLPRTEAAPSFVVTPQLNFSDGTLWITYAGLGFGAAIIQAIALLNGLWPVALFVGLDACALIAGLHVYRLSRARRREEITVTTGEVVVRRFAFRKAVREVRVPLAEAGLTRCEDRDSGCRQLRLTSSHGDLEIGRDLSAKERAGFATALAQSLRRSGAAIPITVTVQQPQPNRLWRAVRR